ncbi:MAG: branched-chain-amino acid aminotransferase [Bacteriovoracaceae bacterium]|jgi:branched-chain amino acid aminotransferase|nr:branched-chain-amino acid aminotransferase [Bacteriovoracaceae bacterium]
MPCFDEFLISINGKEATTEGPHISVFDRGFLFGDSVYEVACSYDGVYFTLTDHIERLWNSCRLLGIHPTQSTEEIIQWSIDLLKKTNKEKIYLRTILTRGLSLPDIKVPESYTTNVIMMARPLKDYPDWWHSDGISLVTSTLHRNPKSSVDPNAKSGNYLNNILAVEQAQKAGAVDSIMMNKEGKLTEGTTFNIWFVKDGKLHTPKSNVGLLTGITRKILLELCKENTIDLIEGEFIRTDLDGVDEMFITSSTKEIVPVSSLDGVSIGDGKPGPVYKKMFQYYIDHVKAQIQGAKSKGLLYT